MATLSLHMTLESQASQEDEPNETNEPNDEILNTNDSNDTNDTNEINQSPNPNGINEINTENDGYFDPFAIEDNNKKFGEIKINSNTKSNESNQIINNTKSNESNHSNNTNQNNEIISTPPLTQSSQSNQSNQSTQPNDEHFDPFAIDNNNKKFGEISNENNENFNANGGNDNNNDIEMSDNMSEQSEEDEDLLREMEENFEKAEKEKNIGIINILAQIKSKHKIQINKKPKQKQKQKQNNGPKFKPFINDGNLKITFTKPPKHYVTVAANPSKKRKKMKNKLKKQLSKTRKKQMNKHKKKYGNEFQIHEEINIKNKYINNNNNNNNISDSDSDININEEQFEQNKDEKSQEITPVIINNDKEEEEEEGDDDDIELENDEDIVDDSDEEEDAYRAALMCEPKIKLSKELRELIDIDAEEENEAGDIICHKFQDEYEEKHGIVKDLLCDKTERKQLKKFKDIYNEKRNEIYNKLRLNDDNNDLELMKKAFIDGKYLQLQNKNKKVHGFMNDGDDQYGNQSLTFKSRNSKINYKNDPQYYLSDNEEKNDYCCYDENGLFNDVNIIRMKIMEWNMKHNNILCEDDEEDINDKIERKKRVQRIEMLVEMDSQNEKFHKIEDDKNAIKILEKVRNKKIRRKKPKLGIANTDFGGFYMENGIPLLKRSNSCTFLDHKEKCMEKVALAEIKSRMTGIKKSNIVSNGKRYVFKRVNNNNNNSRKRGRNGIVKNGNNVKKRRLQ